MSRFRNFLFTWNNYNDDSEKYLRSLAGVTYCCGGYEVGESGTRHIQGYIVFKNAKTKSAVIKIMPGCHITVAETVEQGVAYCKKDGVFFEFGVTPESSNPGVRSVERYQKAWDLAKEGKIDEVDADIRVRSYSTLRRIRADYPPPVELLDGEPDNLWIYGPPGTGKTRGVWAQYPDLYPKSLDKWWEGYRGEEVVLIDDVDKYHRALGSDLKIWAQQYPFVAAVKGSSAKIRPKKVIVTSNYCPGDIWGDDPVFMEAISRRFKLVYHDNK